jgi:small-conductance mechanosensitive channel/CRP-like cAMP-binding protein
VIVLLNRVLWTRVLPDGRRVDAPRLLADTTGLVVFLTVALAVAQLIFGVQVPGLLAGSGVVAIVLGLALQDLLGNIMAGIALYASKPFKPGDWLLVDGHHAKVIEVTWRSTRLLTDEDVVLEVPNNDLVKRPIVNYHQPYPRHALRVTIGLHYDVPPAQAQAVLREAAATVPGVCAEPVPHVALLEFAASSITYEVKFWVEDHGKRTVLMSEVRSHCWYAARRAGMEIPYPIVTLHRQVVRDTAAAARTAAAAALQEHTIFSFLPTPQVDELLRFGRVVLFAADERLVEQGAEGGSMFLLTRGRVEVRVTRDGVTNVVTKLGPGDCLGEMSVLTGEKRSATVVALEEVEAVEIAKAAFAELIHHHPEVLSRLGDLLTQRQLANEQRNTNSPHPTAQAEQTRAGVLRRLQSFFQLGP